MNEGTRLEASIDRIEEQIANMERNNDGSLQWVDDIRDLHLQLWEAEEALAEYGGHREANAR